ncbi:hypothetical protein L7F22_056677 [Adiantum nelumboides]|nr:hypothetical protein [Adiantum nelumboides]
MEEGLGGVPCACPRKAIEKHIISLHDVNSRAAESCKWPIEVREISDSMARLKAVARLKGDKSGALNARRQRQVKKKQKVMEVSVTISVGGGDVDVELLGCMQAFLEKETLAGLCSIERGDTLVHLHLQMVVCMWSSSLVAVNRMVKKYLGWDDAPPPGGVVLCRALTQHKLHWVLS